MLDELEQDCSELNRFSNLSRVAPPFVAHFVRATSPVNGGRGMTAAPLLIRLREKKAPNV